MRSYRSGYCLFIALTLLVTIGHAQFVASLIEQEEVPPGVEEGGALV